MTIAVNHAMNKCQLGATNHRRRDELVEQETRAEEMREYKSWLRQVEEGQNFIKATDENIGNFEFVRTILQES